MLKRLALIVLPMMMLAAGPAHAVSAPSIAGRWVGSYVCGGAQRWVTLQIKYNAGDWVDSRFTFGSYASDKEDDWAPPEGAFHQAGKVIGNHLYLKGDYWYQDAPGFLTVDFDGDFTDDGRTYQGKVAFQGCETFEVRKEGR
jgi:hypothetical protein